MDTKRLLEQFLGPDALASLGGQQQVDRDIARAGAPRESLLGNLGVPGARSAVSPRAVCSGCFSARRRCARWPRGLSAMAARRSSARWRTAPIATGRAGSRSSRRRQATTADIPQTPAALTARVAADGKARRAGGDPGDDRGRQCRRSYRRAGAAADFRRRRAQRPRRRSQGVHLRRDAEPASPRRSPVSRGIANRVPRSTSRRAWPSTPITPTSGPS